MDLLTWSLEAHVIEILIVEDNARFRRMLKSSIRERFPLARVATAGEGEAALRKIKATKPDLVFMDIRMPGRSGIVIAGEIQSLVEGIIARIKNQPESLTL
jgi:CheY-like chemotaxis protein